MTTLIFRGCKVDHPYCFEGARLTSPTFSRVQNGFFVSHSAWKIKKVMNVLQKLKLNTAHLYINITQQAGSFGRHYDKSDVSFWQVQGQSLWLFDDGMRHILNCGDLIQVPANVYHTVLPLGPRAGISMSKTKGEING